MLTNLKPQHLRLIAFLAAIPIAVLGLSTFATHSTQTLVSAGPIQTGHEDVLCADCHTPSTGTLRQQIQANVRYTLGWRDHPTDFGYEPVSSKQCLDCHERDNERHPIYRFNEPRFSEALTQVAANSCLGCHSEHADARAFVEITFCVACHETLVVTNDPLDVSHQELIAREAWDTCLGCHDFHGNHAREAQTALADVYPALDIYNYLANGPSPYGETKIFEGKQE